MEFRSFDYAAIVEFCFLQCVCVCVRHQIKAEHIQQIRRWGKLVRQAVPKSVRLSTLESSDWIAANTIQILSYG